MDDKVQFFSEDINFVHKEEGIVRKLIYKILFDEGKEAEGINIIFCSDEYLLGINKNYLDRDYLTDVISFSLGDENPILGDIFISLDRIKENAGNLSQAFDKELDRIVIHGILHLVGYNDQDTEEKIRMTELEDRYLELLNVSRGTI
jgi:probable rRNA maturation factor